MVGGLRVQQAHRRAEHAGDLRVVAARVRRARARVALRMARHDQRVQLAEHGERRPVAAPATGVGPHTGQREARPRDQSELLERVLDEPGRLDLLEPERGVAEDLLAQPDDLLGAAGPAWAPRSSRPATGLCGWAAAARWPVCAGSWPRRARRRWR